MVDTLKHQKTSIAPAFEFEAVTPSDTADLTVSVRALYIGTTGDLAIYNGQGTAVVFKNLPAGSFVPLNTTRVMATNTTASDIISLH